MVQEVQGGPSLSDLLGGVRADQERLIGGTKSGVVVQNNERVVVINVQSMDAATLWKIMDGGN